MNKQQQIWEVLDSVKRIFEASWENCVLVMQNKDEFTPDKAIDIGNMAVNKICDTLAKQYAVS
jgi:hypothetical protein